MEEEKVALKKAKSSIPGRPIQVFVKSLTGSTYTINLMSNETIMMMKLAVEEKSGVDADNQRIIYGGKELEDSRDLLDYCIGDQSTVHLVVRLRG
jgi:hypothetical protein